MRRIGVALVGVLLLAAPALAGDAGYGQWSMAGQNIADTRYQATEHILSPQNVSHHLALRWQFTTHGDVFATPAVDAGVVYVPDFAGYLYAINARTGAEIWSRKISSYDGEQGAFSRNTPAVFGDELILGDQHSFFAPGTGAHVFAVDKYDGKLLWSTVVDSHPAAVITSSPVVYGDTAYVGVSSVEEGLAGSSSWPCCTFRGSIVALNARTGAIRWQTYMVPDNGGKVGGYSGGAVWGSTIAIDPTRGLLYEGTGNNYTVPASVAACQAQNPDSSTCAAPDDYFDGVVALSLNTGAVRWYTRLQGYDAWTTACPPFGHDSWCPSPTGPDYDLGAGVNLIRTGGRELVGAGQKSGIYWALDPDTGKLVWSTLVGPGGTLGGIEWGTATDGVRVYAPEANYFDKPYILKGTGSYAGQTSDTGGWTAMDPATGKILWQTPDPASTPTHDIAAPVVANGVMYAGSLSGYMYALDAATGRILWRYDSGGSVESSPAVVNGTVYWGSGYSHLGIGTPNHFLFAFSLPGGSH